MQAWEGEKASDEDKKRAQISERKTEERSDLKRKAHAARQAIVKAKQINSNILIGKVKYETLSLAQKRMLEDFNSRKLNRLRDECDAAFGWKRELQDGALNAAERITLQARSPGFWHSLQDGTTASILVGDKARNCTVRSGACNVSWL